MKHFKIDIYLTQLYKIFNACFLIMIISLASTSMSIDAQELNQKQKSLLKKINKKIERLEKSIKKLEDKENKKRSSFINSVKRTSKSLERGINSALKKYSDLPENERTKLDAHCKELRERMQILLGLETNSGSKNIKKNTISLSKKHLSALKKSKTKIANLDKSITSLEATKQKEARYFIRSLKRANGSIDKTIKSIMKIVADLPDSDIAKVKKQTEDLENRLHLLSNNVDKNANDKATFKAAWTTLRQSTEYTTDVQILRKVLSIPMYIFELNFRNFSTTKAIETLASLSTMPEKLDTLEEKYKNFGDNASAIMNDISQSRENLHSINAQVKNSIDTGIDFLQIKDKELRDAIANVFEMKKKVEENGKYVYSLGFVLMDKNQSIQRQVQKIQEWTKYLTSVSKENSSRFQKQAQKSIMYCKKITDEVTADIVANKKFPKNDYAGKDRKQLEAFVRSHFSQDKIVGIYFRDNWYREKKKEWIESNSSYEERDRSNLEGKILIKIDDKWALERWIRIIKDHMSADKLVFKRDMRLYPDPRPDQKFLIDRIK